MAATGKTVDRTAETKVNYEVDSDKVEAEPGGAHDPSNQEEDTPGITFLIHQVPADKEPDLLKGFRDPYPTQLFCSVGQSVIFGRGEDADVFLNDETASRTHMELTATLDKQLQLEFKVKKLSQCQFSLSVNNEFLQNEEERYLRTLDQIQLSQLTFRVEINSNSLKTNTDNYKLKFQYLPVQHIAAAHAPAENDEVFFNNELSKIISVQETQPPKQSIIKTSVEETEPPKDN